MARAVAGFLRAADIQLFDRITKAKGYKHIPIERDDGSMRPAQTSEEFCRLVFDASYRVMAESRQTLEALGAECYEIARDLGLPRAQMRLLLSLPEDERKVVEEAMQAGDKGEVITLIQSLANKLDEARAESAHLKGEVTSKEELLAEKNEQLDNERAKNKRIAKAPPDEVLAGIKKDVTVLASEVEGILRGMLFQAITALEAHHKEHGGDSRMFLAGHISQIKRSPDELVERFCILDITHKDEFPWAYEEVGGAADRT